MYEPWEGTYNTGRWPSEKRRFLPLLEREILREGLPPFGSSSLGYRKEGEPHDPSKRASYLCSQESLALREDHIPLSSSDSLLRLSRPLAGFLPRRKRNEEGVSRSSPLHRRFHKRRKPLFPLRLFTRPLFSPLPLTEETADGHSLRRLGVPLSLHHGEETGRKALLLR